MPSREQVALTETEQETLMDVWDNETTVSASAFFPVVARMIAVRTHDLRTRLSYEREGNRFCQVCDDHSEGEAALSERLHQVEAESNEWESATEVNYRMLGRAEQRAMKAEAALAEARQREERVRALAAVGEDEPHNGHASFEGEPECPACWVAGIKAALGGDDA
jgi:hypothetical protein